MSAVSSWLWKFIAAVNGWFDRLSDRRFALFAFLPILFLVGLFVLPPILAVFVMSTFRIELLRAGDILFVGARNFQRIFTDAEFIDSIPITIAFAAGSTALAVPLALLSALVLNRSFRGSSWVGIAFLLPWAIAPVVTGIFWKFIFNPQFGIMTTFANVLGLAEGPIPWLSNGRFANVVLIIAAAWRAVPLLSLLLLARLRSIPESQYRAARMDGASTWQSFLFVTLPSLKKMLLVVTILQVILALQIFDIIFTLTGGGPGRATTTMIFYVFQTAIGLLSFGYSAALAIFLMGLIVLFSAILVYLNVRDRTTAADDIAAGDMTQASVIASGSLGLAAAQKSVSLVSETPAKRRTIRLPAWLGRVAFVGVGAALVVWSVGPIAWIVIASFQPEAAITTVPPTLRMEIYLDSYKQVLSSSGWLAATWTSTQVAVLTTAIVLVLGGIAAYPLARLDMPGKGPIMLLLISTQMVPAIVLAIPVFLTFKVFLRELGLYDTVTALVLVNAAFSLPIVIWLMRNVFEDVPKSLESAARMDGCSRIGTIFRVLFPAAAPGIAAVAILMLIGTWNEFLFAVMLGDREAVTLTRLISRIDVRSSVQEAVPFSLTAAAGVLAVLPAVLLVLAFHRKIVTGLSRSGGVKG